MKLICLINGDMAEVVYAGDWKSSEIGSIPFVSTNLLLKSEDFLLLAQLVEHVT